MRAVLLKNKQFKNFLNQSGIHGLRLLLYYTPFKYARLIWSLFMLTIIIWTQFIIISLGLGYIQQPTEVHLSTHQVHVSNTSFPGIAVCSPNRLNSTRVLQFAKEIFRKQQTYKPFYLAQNAEEMAQHLLNLKGFFVYPYDNKPFNLTVIDRLDDIFTFMFNTTDYPIRSYLKYLAPDCESLVIRGIIFGEVINTTHYFHKRLTSSSVCCMFNYRRKSYSLDTIDSSADIKFESNSVLNSIQFVLRSEPNNVTFTEFRNKAFQIFIFPRNDYATIQSNRIGEILVDYNTMVEIPIEPQLFSSNVKVRQFAPEVRNCYFFDEGQKFLNQSYYSLDECLLLCRKDSMIKHCGCVAPPMADSKTNIKFCNFSNLLCLRKWKEIWYSWDYFEHVNAVDGKGKKRIPKSKGHCPKCLPGCNGVDFNIEVNEVAMRPNHGDYYKYGLLNGLKSTDRLAIAKLYFKQRYVLSTERNIVGDWVVLLNRFGGIMSLMYGFSIMSFIEIIYFVTGKFFVSYYKTWQLKIQYKLSSLMALCEKKVKVAENTGLPTTHDLYWRELKPQLLVDTEIFKSSIQNLSHTNKYN